MLHARINSQIDLLEKYCLDSSRLNVNFEKIDVENKTIDKTRSRLTGIEGKCTEQYFKEYWKLFPKCLKPNKREKYKAQSPLNNLLNLGYEIMKGEVYKAVLQAHLDPYLGYLHSIQFAKSSLVCDVQEIFRVLIEEFLVKYHQKLEPESFEQKGKRVFLKPEQKLKLILEVTRLFRKRIPYKRRNCSKKTTIHTIIKEEPIKLAKYLRGNKSFYEPLEIKRFSNTLC
jgi:CRISPR-associated protein Cas1